MRAITLEAIEISSVTTILDLTIFSAEELEYNIHNACQRGSRAFDCCPIGENSPAAARFYPPTNSRSFGVFHFKSLRWNENGEVAVRCHGDIDL